MKHILFLLTTLCAINFASANNAYNYPRIFWDHNNPINTGEKGGYGRVIELQDGRLMLLHGNTVIYSSDGGDTWDGKQTIASKIHPTIPYASPDFIQLSDGTIVVGLNTRPSEPYTEDRLFGIRTVRSTDNGQTWEEPVYVYDAKHEFENGCWEPAFLELPSGELQCYFADESDFTSSIEQCISMCRSFDKGKTWSERTRVSFKAGSRDGMPVPILTPNNEIVVIIEDNGWPNSGFHSTTVRCSLEDNWSEPVLANSPNRNIIFEDDNNYLSYHSPAPYLRNHPDGYTIASWMGDHFGRPNMQQSTYDMFVAVGDIDARNFKGITAPFDQPLDQTSQWNSVTVLRDGTILAVGNGNANSEFTIMRGYLKDHFDANYGTPVVDGTSLQEAYTDQQTQQITLGSKYKNRINADFLYDNEYIYFTTFTTDNIINLENDGYELFFDFENLCTTNEYGQLGMFQLYFGIGGKVELKAGNNNRWTTVNDVSSIKYFTNIQDTYYETEVAIPWSLLGYTTPPVNNTIRFDFRIKDFDEKFTDITIPDAVRRQSASWMELKLTPNPDSGIDEIATNNSDREVLAIADGETLHVSCMTSDMQSITLISSNGMTIDQAYDCGSSYSINALSPGLYIVKVTLANGNSITKKVII